MLAVAILSAIGCSLVLAALLTWGSWGATVRSERRRRKREAAHFDRLLAELRANPPETWPAEKSNVVPIKSRRA